MHWCSFDYDTASSWIDQLLIVRPNSPYGILFRAHCVPCRAAMSKVANKISRLLLHWTNGTPHVRFVVAMRTLMEYLTQREPFGKRIWHCCWTRHAAPSRHSSRFAFRVRISGTGRERTTSSHQHGHSQNVAVAPLAEGDTYTLDLVPGRTLAIPIQAAAGANLSLVTDSPAAKSPIRSGPA